MTLDFVSNEEIVHAARKNLKQGQWDYLVGGSESETTLRRNRLGFDRLAFRPRVLVDVSHIDTSTTFLGQPLRMPVLLAPIGSLQEFHPAGAANSSIAAHEFGIMPVISSATEPSLEETAVAAPGPKIFQLYVRGDAAWTRDILQRVKAAGYIALALTVDLAVYSRRERPMLTRYLTPTRRAPAEPKWLASLTWETMDAIRAEWGGPFMLKGIATAEDAELAVQHGVDVIWVSNHGGRQLDHGLGAIEVLPEIVEAVRGRAKIVLDGGVQRATDIVKAVALGADAVAIGRLHGWGMAAAGKDGVVRVLEILEHEMISAMGLLGTPSLKDLNPRFLRAAEPVTPPHEMSGWVNMPRIG